MKLLPNIALTVATALAEDLSYGDITADLLPEKITARAQISTREDAIICGIPWVNELFHQLDPKVTLSWQVQDGDKVAAGQVLGILSGNAKSLLTGERTALNFLQTLSATATLTNRYVNALSATKTKLLDTRKTIPGLRYAQKYAVRCGGGNNHRLGLYDAFLIKENHIMACGSIEKAINLARINHPEKIIEIEVENLDELKQALQAKADIILLDNFTMDMLKEAVIINKAQAKLEVSGNVTIDNLAIIAATGVDYISVGALTKNIKAIDLSLRFIA